MSPTNYEIEIPINGPREQVWKAMIELTNEWWLPDFRVAGADSTMTFDVTPGGLGLTEQAPDGAWLSWFNVHMFQPADFKVYLIGHVAPEWGGPATSSLKLALEPDDTGCVLKVVDARHGNADEKQVESYKAGWTQLFTDGLKKFVETGSI